MDTTLEPLILGIPEVDTEHMEMHRFLKLCVLESHSTFTQHSWDILKWWDAHTELEVRFMTQRGYPLLDQHIKSHNMIRGYLVASMDPNGKLNPLFDIHSAILIHINTEDKHWAEWK